MKKYITFLLVFTMMLILQMSAFAASGNDNQISNAGTTNVTVTTSISPSYTVQIPANVSVEYNKLSTEFGSIKLESARLDPGYAVKVNLDASGTLKNLADNSKTIAYVVNDGTTAFTAAQYTTAGQETPLTINITQEAWNSAYAGSYSDTVTFTVSYIDTNTNTQ